MSYRSPHHVQGAGGVSIRSAVRLWPSFGALVRTVSYVSGGITLLAGLDSGFWVGEHSFTI